MEGSSPGYVVYNASNNELVRTQTLVKSAIVQVDAAPFKQWHSQARVEEEVRYSYAASILFNSLCRVLGYEFCYESTLQTTNSQCVAVVRLQSLKKPYYEVLACNRTPFYNYR